VTTHAPLRSRRTKAQSVYHVQGLGDGEVPTSPLKDTRLEAVRCTPWLGAPGFCVPLLLAAPTSLRMPLPYDAMAFYWAAPGSHDDAGSQLRGGATRADYHMPTVAFWHEPGPQHRKPKLLQPGQGRRLVRPFRCDHALLALHEGPPLGCVPRPFTSIDQWPSQDCTPPAPWQKKGF
jgi:hypothetical protein